MQDHKEEENFKVGPNLVCAKGKHYFVYLTASQIECRKCGTGYPVGPEIALKEGTITVHGEELVI